MQVCRLSTNDSKYDRLSVKTNPQAGQLARSPNDYYYSIIMNDVVHTVELSTADAACSSGEMSWSINHNYLSIKQ